MAFDIMLCSAITLFAGILMQLVANRYTPREANVLRLSFVMHVAFTLANMWVVKNIYGRGDMYAFYAEAQHINDLIALDPTIIWDVVKWSFNWKSDFRMRVGSEGTHLMVGITTLVTALFFNSFAAMSFVPALVSYFGKVAMFALFRDMLGASRRHWVAISFTALPSVVFWTAGMIKESIAVSAMGLVAYGTLRVIRSRTPASMVLLGVGLFFLQAIKGHFLLTGVVGLAVLAYWIRSTKGGTVEIKPISLVAAAVAGFVGLVVVGQIVPRFSITNLADEIVHLQTHRGGGSKIDLGVTEGMGLREMVVLTPLALFTGLYRPLIFEAGSAPAMANSLETTFLLLFSVRAIRRARNYGFMASLVRSPWLIFLVIFSTLSLLGVGLATGNLGTLSRYRAPVMPFFVLALLVMDQMPQRAASKKTNKKRVRAVGLRSRPARRKRPARPPIPSRRRDLAVHTGSGGAEPADAT